MCTKIQGDARALADHDNTVRYEHTFGPYSFYYGVTTVVHNFIVENRNATKKKHVRIRIFVFFFNIHET